MHGAGRSGAVARDALDEECEARLRSKWKAERMDMWGECDFSTKPNPFGGFYANHSTTKD